MKLLPRALAGLLVLLAAVVGGYTAINWVPDRPVEELKPRWAPPPSQFVDVAGMSVHLRDEGPREDPLPIVLLHGTSASLHTWDGWVGVLKTDRRVIRFDMPGFGLTGPNTDDDYSVEAYVRFVVAMLDHLGVQRCVLAGNSFGGYVSWMTAVTHPDRVERLVLVDAGGYAYKPTSIPLGFRLARIHGLEFLVERVTPRRIVEASVRNVFGDPSKVTDELVDRYYELLTRAGNRHALVQRFRQPGPGGTAARIPELRVPTLILWGGDDRLIPPDSAERFHHDIAGSQLVMFEGLGHTPQEEDPVKTVAPVRAFVAADAAPTTPSGRSGCRSQCGSANPSSRGARRYRVGLHLPRA